MTDREQRMEVVTRLDATLRRAGIPIHGVSWGTPPIIQYDPAATREQRDAGAAVLAAFDLTPRRPRTRAGIQADLNNMTPADRALFRELAIRELEVDLLLSRPALAREAGLSIDGDEPDGEVS